MDQRFFPVFFDLWREFGGQAPPRPSRHPLLEEATRDADRIAFNAVNRARERHGNRVDIRPDALVFLTANIAYLVTRPLIEAALKDPAQAPSRDVIEIKLDQDLETVMGAIKEKEVSAAEVARVLPGVLEKLTLKDWRLWDRE